MDLKKSKTVSDKELVERLKNKEERAFTILVEKYKSPLFYSIYHIVGNTLDAEDLTMITFTKVFTSIDSYSPDYLFSTWLFRIARNTSIDFMKFKSHRIYGNEDLSEHLVSLSPNPEQLLISKESVKILRYRLQHLNPKFRETIILRLMLRCTFRDIEQNYGIPVSTGIQNSYRSRIFFKNAMS